MGIGLKGLIWSFLAECLWRRLPPLPFFPLCGVWGTQPHPGHSCIGPQNTDRDS